MNTEFFSTLWQYISTYAVNFVDYFLRAYPIWLPLLAFYIFYIMWINYIRTDFISKQESVLLEIKLPKDVFKSPAAMEIIFTSLYQTGSSTLIETFWLGKVRPWFSLELVSTEGTVHFYIWTWAKFRELLESQIYAQYPGIEIYEVPDYMSWLYHDPENIPMWATNYKLSKADVYPIKTYIDYGLHMDPKEEFKIDPMTSVIEYLGSLGKGEHAWIQILIQAHKEEKLSDARFVKKADWKKDAKEEIKKIIKENTPDGDPNKMTQIYKDQIFAIERSVNKYGFETMIRGMYLASKENFKIGIRIAGLIGAFRQYSSNMFNGFKLGQFTDFDYPWQDFRRMRRNMREKSMIQAFKMRSYHQPPFNHYGNPPFILTTEELATIFHFPGGVAGTPTFGRIASRKSEPPSNLPI